MARLAAEREPSPAHVQDAIRSIERLHDDLLTERGESMNRCAKINAKIKDAIALAADRGIPRVELKALLKIRELRFRAAMKRAELEKDQRARLDMLNHKLGKWADTPMGSWASQRIDGQKLSLAEPISEWPTTLSQNKKRPDAEHLEKVGRGTPEDDPLDDLTTTH